jgi:hypothetical protein
MVEELCLRERLEVGQKLSLRLVYEVLIKRSEHYYVDSKAIGSELTLDHLEVNQVLILAWLALVEMHLINLVPLLDSL